MLKNKKGISTIIAITLMIVITLITTIIFQIWYQNYSSETFNKVEMKSPEEGFDEIEGVIGDELYYKNTKGNNLTINKIEIGEIDCNISGIYSGQIININVSSCVTNLTSDINEIVIYTDSGILSKSEYFKEIQISQDGISTTLILNNFLISSGQLSTYGSGTGDDFGYGVTIDNTGNIYVVGKTKSNLVFGNGVNITTIGFNNFFLVKYNSLGEAIYAKTNMGELVDITVDDFENVYVVGEAQTVDLDFGNGITMTNDGDYDFFLVKYDSSGVPQFVKTSESGSGTSYEYSVENGIYIDNSNNIYIVGKTMSNLNFGDGITMTNDGKYDFFLVKYDSAGNSQFVKTSENGINNEYPSGVFLDNYNNIYFTGCSESNLGFGNGSNLFNSGFTDFFVYKYSNMTNSSFG